MTGIHKIDMTTKMTTKTRPTTISSTSVEFFLIRFHMSIVKMTEQELKTDVREDMSAAIITATYKSKDNIVYRIRFFLDFLNHTYHNAS